MDTPVEWISAARTQRKMYTIKGSDGKLSHKIGINDFPKNVLASLTEKRSSEKIPFTWFKKEPVGQP